MPDPVYKPVFKQGEEVKWHYIETDENGKINGLRIRTAEGTVVDDVDGRCEPGDTPVQPSAPDSFDKAGNRIPRDPHEYFCFPTSGLWRKP